MTSLLRNAAVFLLNGDSDSLSLSRDVAGFHDLTSFIRCAIVYWEAERDARCSIFFGRHGFCLGFR